MDFSKQEFIERMKGGESADDIREKFLTTLGMAEREYRRQTGVLPSVSHETVLSYYPMRHVHTITIIV